MSLRMGLPWVRAGFAPIPTPQRWSPLWRVCESHSVPGRAPRLYGLGTPLPPHYIRAPHAPPPPRYMRAPPPLPHRASSPAPCVGAVAAVAGCCTLSLPTPPWHCPLQVPWLGGAALTPRMQRVARWSRQLHVMHRLGELHRDATSLLLAREPLADLNDSQGVQGPAHYLHRALQGGVCGWGWWNEGSGLSAVGACPASLARGRGRLAGAELSIYSRAMHPV